LDGIVEGSSDRGDANVGLKVNTVVSRPRVGCEVGDEGIPLPFPFPCPGDATGDEVFFPPFPFPVPFFPDVGFTEVSLEVSVSVVTKVGRGVAVFGLKVLSPEPLITVGIDEGRCDSTGDVLSPPPFPLSPALLFL